jgi:hypothetical protein
MKTSDGLKALDSTILAARLAGASALRDESLEASHGEAWLRWWNWCDDRGLSARSAAEDDELFAEWLTDSEATLDAGLLKATWYAVRSAVGTP